VQAGAAFNPRNVLGPFAPLAEQKLFLDLQKSAFPNLINALIAGELAAERFMDQGFSCQRGHERLS
jgi:hypothetical protein